MYSIRAFIVKAVLKIIRDPEIKYDNRFYIASKWLNDFRGHSLALIEKWPKNRNNYRKILIFTTFITIGQQTA